MTYEEALKVIESNRPTSGYIMLCEALDKAKEAFNRLAELEDKIENGTLVELPCKVGDTAYELFIHHRPPFIQESTIEKIIIKPEGLRIKLSRNTMYETSISSLGKTIFLTREEAEKSLENMRKAVSRNDT